MKGIPEYSRGGAMAKGVIGRILNGLMTLSLGITFPIILHGTGLHDYVIWKKGFLQI